jgi:hypothetical protein
VAFDDTMSSDAGASTHLTLGPITLYGPTLTLMSS